MMTDDPVSFHLKAYKVVKNSSVVSGLFESIKNTAFEGETSDLK